MSHGGNFGSRRRQYPEHREKRGRHTFELTRASHGAPGFSKALDLDLEQRVGDGMLVGGDVGHLDHLCHTSNFGVTRLQRNAVNTHEFGYFTAAGVKVPVFTDSGGSSITNVDHGVVGPFSDAPIWYVEDKTCTAGPLRIDSGDSRMLIEYGPLAAGPEAWKPALPAGAFRIYWNDEDTDCAGNPPPTTSFANLVVQIEPDGDLPLPTVETWEANPGTSIRSTRCDVKRPHGRNLSDDSYHGAQAISVQDAGGHWGGNDVEEVLAEVGQRLGGLETDSVQQAFHGRFLFASHRDDNKFPITLTSDDGISWTELGQIAAYAGRDPTIVHWDGKFWASHTENGQRFPIYSSPDGETWTFVAWITVTGITGLQGAWAPEWFVDDDGSVYLFFCATTNADLLNGFKIYAIQPSNRAMSAFGSSVEVTGTSLPSSMLDPFVVRKDGTYHLWYKHNTGERIEYASSASLLSGYTVTQSGNWAGWGTQKEAPCLVELDDGRWRIYFNQYSGLDSVAEWYSESTDDWATWSAAVALSVSPEIAHGTVIRSRGVYDHERRYHSTEAVAALDDLTDAQTSGQVGGAILAYDGTAWRPAYAPEPLLLEDDSLAVLENGHVAISEPEYL